MKLIIYSSRWNNMIKQSSFNWMLMSIAVMIFGFPAKNFAQDIVINEINYDYNRPFRGYNAKDWVELYNTTPNPVDMSGWILADEDTLFTFPLGFAMPANSYYIAAKDALDFLEVHPSVFNVIESDLSFSSGGETIKLYSDSLVTLVDSVAYNDKSPWPEDPDGEGPTLSLSDPMLDNNDPASWFSSNNIGGSPGRANQIFCTTEPPNIVINEINYKPTALFNPKDWVELYNPNSFAVDISGWEFVDEKGYFKIPAGVSIPADGYHVLVQQGTAFRAIFGNSIPHTGDWVWGLDGGGEDIGLFTDDRCLVDKVDYDDDLPWPDDTDSTGYTITLIDADLNNNLPGSWVSSSAIGIIFGTPGQANNVPDPCNPTPDPIVINEINYNSDTLTSAGNWIELYNPNTTAIDVSGWRFYDEDSLFVIPPSTIIPPDDYLVLVEDDVRFAAAYPAVSNYVGSMGFGLNNNKERIILYTANQCMVDSLRYNDDLPWPEEPDGNGPTLSLLDASLDNTAPASWAASPPLGTPGAANITCVKTDIYVYMQGPYDPTTGLMNNALNVSHGVLPGQTPSNPSITPTPALNPYTIAPWNYTGTQGIGFGDSTYTADVVDWILLSFRTAVERNTEVARTAALLLQDGQIQLVDRCPLTSLNDANPLNIVVEHRNHMGVMSHLPVPLVGGTLSYDFRNKQSYVGPDPNMPIGAGQVDVAGTFSMYAGDGDQTGDVFSFDVNGSDKTIWTIQNGQFGQYRDADYDLDGDVNGNDKLIWFPNNGTSSRVPR